ncbi:MAG: cytochrome c biogenesis protein CcdA [Pirellulales bacterium]|nr:cytochrome c biogenesis protein CcdA [Pirellulales bacterium]
MRFCSLLTSRYRAFLATAAVLAVALPFGGEGKSQAAERVEVSAQIFPQQGAKAELRITTKIIPGWHIYSITQKPGGPKPTRINLVASNRYRIAGDFVAVPPAVVHHYDFWPDLDVEEHEQQVTWSVPIEAENGWQGVTIAGDVQGQVCKDLCVNFSQTFEASVAPGAPSISDSIAGPPPPVSSVSPQPEQNPQSESFSTPYVDVSGELVPGGVEEEGRTQLILRAMLAPEWHVYSYEKQAPSDPVRSRPTLIVLDQRDGLLAGTPRASSPVISKARDQFPEYVDNFHHGDVDWIIDIEVPEDARTGTHTLSGWFGFMACKDDGTMCDPPKAAKFEVTLEVGQKLATNKRVTFVSASYAKAASAAERAAPWDLVIPQAKAWTWGALITNMGWALLAGLLLNVMPCVLPVIGLKAMSFVQQANESRSRILTLNLAFSAGILFVFLILALFAAFAGLAWADQFQDPRFGIAMAALVFVFALSLLGIWEIPIPGFVGSSAAQSVAEREGLSAAFFKGVLSTLLATPCVGPFMFTGLTFAAEQHSPVITLVIFGAMGIGMALPFLLIGAFPAWIRFLPKPGGWMESFKHLMGFVLLGTVVWIFYAFVPDHYFVPALGLLFGLWLACWWANRTPMTAALPERLYGWLVAAVLAAFTGYASFALLEKSPHAQTAQAASGDWELFSQETLDRLREQGSTVLIDFTADG